MVAGQGFVDDYFVTGVQTRKHFGINAIADAGFNLNRLEAGVFARPGKDIDRLVL